jgi:hypothetical protein
MLKTALFVFEIRHESLVVANVTWVGPAPANAELQTKPTGTLDTLAPRTVKPDGTMITMQPSGCVPPVMVTDTVVVAPSVSVVGDSATDQGPAGAPRAGLTCAAKATKVTIAANARTRRASPE